MSAPTVTVNPGIARKLGGFSTLHEGLDYAARGVTGFNFYSPRGKLETVLTYRELRERARVTARRLMELGLARGARVAIVAETSPNFMEVFFGCQYAGFVPVPVPYSMYIGGREAYIARLKGMISNSGASLVIAPQALSDQVSEAAGEAQCGRFITHEDLAQQSIWRGELAPFTADETAYIQYSSGSTSDPKGVLITQKAIMANADVSLRFGLKPRADDRGFSWLPLYHDMGLVGFCIGPMLGQLTIDYLATPAFARRPLLWLKIMSENRCTVAYSPSFGYDLVVRRLKNEIRELDLSCWRVAGIGGDMVRPDILHEFADTFRPAGFAPRAFNPSYGMAESTLAVTFSDMDDEIVIDRVDRNQAKLFGRAVPAKETDQDGVATTREFVACGKPLPGHELVVFNSKGRRLGDREIGHILIRGPSVMQGYFRNREATAAVMKEGGWMDTGDMGYMLNGQIVITGRSKDLILHNGRNIWPQDIEWAAEEIAPLRKGDAAAFSVERDNDEKVVVLVQCRMTDEGKQISLRREIGAIVQRHAGVDCDVILVPPRSLPFTSSGKLSRAGAREGFLSGEIVEISSHVPQVQSAGVE